MKKILIITWVPFYKWDYVRYDLDILKKNYNIKIFDISNIMFRKYKLSQIYIKQDKIKCKEFNNVKKVISEIKRAKIDLVINLTGLNENHLIYKELVKKKIKILSFIDFKLDNYFYFPKKFILYLKFIFRKFSIFFIKKNSNDIAFIAGNNIQNKLNALGKKIIHTHSINYDLILRKKIKKKNKHKKKIVSYIDSGYGFHPDFKLSTGINKKFNTIRFSKKLNFFFKTLGDLGYKVYFLANPKVPQTKQKIYKNCKIIYYKTHEYIRNSDLVVFTDSSTIEYGIIYKKKLLRIFSNELEAYPINFKSYKGFTKFFSKNALGLDEKNTKQQILNKIILPNNRYDEFKSNFIKHPKSKNLRFLYLIKKMTT